MVKINWEEFKEFKTSRHLTGDNFTSLLDFIKSYYNVISPVEIYETLTNDELAVMMLEKRDITHAEHLEPYLFKALQ